MRRILRLPSHSVVVAAVVLIVAGAGAALAADPPTATTAASATTTAKRSAKKYAKSYAQTYARRFALAGPAGPAGLQGSKGDKGEKGDKGDIGPSDGFVFRDASSTPIGTGPDDTIVAQLSLPSNASYIVTAAVELGNNAASTNSVQCKLLENFNPLGQGTEDLTPLATFSRTMTLTGASTGGTIRLACVGIPNAATARNRVITAVKVGKLNS